MSDAHSSETEHYGPAHALERMMFFSDAVFAIAITLLVIELHAPELPHGSPDMAYWQALADHFASFVGFFVSFFVIGSFWAGHHRAFDCARHWSPKLLFPNLMVLCSIAALPFFTAFASANWGERVPVALYCFWLLVIALLNIRVQRIATRPPVVGEEVPPAHAAYIRVRGLSVAFGAITGLLVSLKWPIFGQPALISILFWRLGLTWWWNTRPTPAPEAETA